jgi:hypothetical protein
VPNNPPNSDQRTICQNIKDCIQLQGFGSGKRHNVAINDSCNLKRHFAVSEAASLAECHSMPLTFFRCNGHKKHENARKVLVLFRVFRGYFIQLHRTAEGWPKNLIEMIFQSATFAPRCIKTARPELIEGHSFFEKLEERR